jgi:redox-sensitive bicupin YhaK (pirin superfamily)
MSASPETARAKRVATVLPAPEPHWVGDGFPVRTIFAAHENDPSAISPFLLLDCAGPAEFPPSTSGRPRGVDEHPHRGFETVTIVAQGEVDHRDSSGNRGTIGPGDVQWMTAAAGVVHEEKHGRSFTERGGTFELVQLWVNLPAREKMSKPRYQEIRSAQIPVVDLPGGAGTLRVVAGAFGGQRGPAKTVTPMNVWDVKLRAGGGATLPLPPRTNSLVVVLRGGATVADTPLRLHECAILGRDGGTVAVRAEGDAALLVLNGEPIDEPVVARGPFVMNTAVEIKQAMIDYQSGRMGRLDPAPR